MTGMRKRLGSALVCIVGLFVAAGVWQRRVETSAVPEAPAAPSAAERRNESAPTSRGLATEGPDQLVSMPAGERLPDDLTLRLSAAIEGGDPLEWEPIMGELRNPIYDREEVIRALAQQLTSPNRMVRVRAAQQLLELGSRAGVPALAETLRLAVAGESVSAMAAATAANVLHQFRQEVSGDDLFECWRRYNEQLFLELAVLHDAKQAYLYVQDQRASGHANYRSDWVAAYMGMQDRESMERYRELTAQSSDYRAQLLGHWALYQAGAGREHFEFLAGTAREVVGLAPRAERSQPWAGTSGMVFDLLKITTTPEATRVLEEIADGVATQKTANSDAFQRAFGSLFYLHHDYEFVDQRVIAFIRGEYGGPAVSPSLMWRIAAARANPQVTAAAKAANPTAYEREVQMLRNRPVESWADLSYVPRRVAPPLR